MESLFNKVIQPYFNELSPEKIFTVYSVYKEFILKGKQTDNLGHSFFIANTEFILNRFKSTCSTFSSN